MENNSLINNQNILLDYLDQPMNITFSTPSPLKSLVTKLHTRFTANNPHIKNSRLYNRKYDQTALDYLKRQILTEATQEIRKCNASKCSTSSTSDNICSLKTHI